MLARKPVAPLLFVASVLTVAGCSTRPLPEQQTEKNSYQIAQLIRCEAQDAIKSHLRGALIHDDYPEGKLIAEALKDGTLTYEGFFSSDIKSTLPEEISNPITRYERAVAVYDFTFDITEDNNFSAGSTFFDAITAGTFKLGITAENNRRRKNLRNFLASDVFKELILDDALRDQCLKIGRGDGFFYPISGKVGLSESFTTFLSLNQSANLIGSDGKNVPTLSDTMEFTTEIKFGVSPSIEINTGVTNIRLGDANIGPAIARKDVHKLGLVLKLPPPPRKDAGTTAKTPDEINQEFQRERNELIKQGVEELKRLRQIEFQQSVVIIQN